MSKTREVPCKECDGKGYDFDPAHFSNSRCRTCDASGKVVEEIITKRFILRFTGDSFFEQDLLRLRAADYLSVLDDAGKMLLVEIDKDKISTIRKEFPNWLIVEEKFYTIA